MSVSLVTQPTWLLGSGQTVNVLRYDDSGNYVDQFVGFSGFQGGYCYGLAADDRGAIYIADYSGNVWAVLNAEATTDPIQLITPGTGGFAGGSGSLAPASMTASPDRNLYLLWTTADDPASGVFTGLVISRFALAFKSVSEPLLATPNGLSGIPNDATFLDLTAAGFSADPGGMTFGPDGNLYLSAIAPANRGSGTPTVYVYGTDGTQIRSFATNGYSGALRFGPDGLLYVLAFGADNLSSIERFDSTTGAPAGVNGPSDSHVVPYGTPELTYCNDMAIYSVGGDIQAFVATWYEGDPAGGGIVNFDMATGVFTGNFVPDGSGGAFQPQAILITETQVPVLPAGGPYQITCALFSYDNGTPYIGAIGGTVNGRKWVLNKDEAIAGIQAGDWSFYTSANGVQANVVTGKSASGYLYLTTTPDGTIENNLDYIAQNNPCSES